MKKIGLILSSVLILTACNSTPTTKESLVKINTTQPIEVKGVLTHNNSDFKFSHWVESHDHNNMLSEDKWVFDAETLYPDGGTERFDCNPKNRAVRDRSFCKNFEKIDSPFLYVNIASSEYGNTLQERIDKTGSRGITGGHVMGTLMGAALLPVAAVGAGMESAMTGSAFDNKYVEFDHDSFVDEVESALIEKFGSLESYQQTAIAITATINELREFDEKMRLLVQESYVQDTLQYLKIINKELKVAKAPSEFKSKLSEFTPSFELSDTIGTERINLEIIANKAEIKDRISISYRQQLERRNKQAVRSVQLFADKVKEEQAEAYAQQVQSATVDKQSKVSIERFISLYSDYDALDLLPKANDRLNEIVGRLKIEQKEAFSRADSIKSLTAFISSYVYNDYNNLLPQARNQLNKLRREAAQEQQKILITKIQTFRSSFAEGDYSNCGLIVERKEKVALVQTMQGSVYLPIEKIYPKGLTGCKFYNGVYVPPTGLPI